MPAELTVFFPKGVCLYSSHKTNVAGDYIKIGRNGCLWFDLGYRAVKKNSELSLMKLASACFKFLPGSTRAKGKTTLALDRAFLIIDNDGKYVQLVHPKSKREIAYWNHEEFADGAREVLGALMGAIARYHKSNLVDLIAPSKLAMLARR